VHKPGSRREITIRRGPCPPIENLTKIGDSSSAASYTRATET
jgi:hypothetical protein